MELKINLCLGGMFHLLSSNAKTKANYNYYNNNICWDWTEDCESCWKEKEKCFLLHFKEVEMISKCCFFSIILSIYSRNLILVTPQVYLWWESHPQRDDFVYACVCKWDPPHVIIDICCWRLLWSSFVYFTMCCDLVRNTNVLSPFAWIVTKLESQGLSYFAFPEDNTN